MWYPQRLVDYAEMEKAGAQGLYDKLHEKAPFHDGTFKSWAKERSSRHPFHYNDGVTIIVTPEDLNPGDRFTTDRNATPFSGGPADQ